MKAIKEILDQFYKEYDFEGRMTHDPIQFPHRYRNYHDIEVVAFISSCFAYGRVELFIPVIDSILKRMGKSPYEFIGSFNIKERNLFSGIKYRFNTNDDIVCLIYILNRIINSYRSIHELFKLHDKKDSTDISSGLTGIIDTMLSIDTSPVYRKNIRPEGLLQFFPSPRNGSACKRMNLFVRWMVRDRDIDLGLWQGIGKNRLIIPLDTHIARISRCLGFTIRKTQDWRMAIEITESLRRLDRDDPLKYDFALCHHGISGICEKGCSSCEFKKIGVGLEM